MDADGDGGISLLDTTIRAHRDTQTLRHHPECEPPLASGDADIGSEGDERAAHRSGKNVMDG
jgi:hypothetical protein